MKPSARYRRIRRHLTWITVGANVCGAFLTTFYFSNVQFGSTEEAATGFDPTVLIMILMTVSLLILGSSIAGRREAPMWAWYLEATRGGECEPAAPRIRQLALHVPAYSAGVSWGMWLLAGLFSGIFAGFVGQEPGFDWTSFVIIALGAVGIAGPITAALVYFASERVWRSELSLFFPDGVLSQTPAFRMTIRRRMLILFVMGAMPLILLAVLSYNQAVQIANSSQPEALLAKLLRLELFLAIVGALEAAVLAQTLGASLIEPLETLGKRMDTVQDGDLEHRLEVTSNDELGRLAEGFNAMVDGLRREDVIRRLFSLYVTPQVAEHAIEHGVELGGQMTDATILFADIRGFTSMTERLEPDALIALLNRYFDAMSDVVIEHGGLVNKFGGDSLLAVFGTPLNPAADHARRAIQTAGMLLRALETFNQDQVRRREPSLRIGVGVATGQILAGNVGSSERLECTVIGDAVNLASRLDSMTKELDAAVLISEATAAAAQSPELLRPVGQVPVRGKREPVQVYTLQNLTNKENTE
jgi:adenylate cyclase